MYLKPYSDIESAIKYWNLKTDEVKIKCHNNIYKDERALIDAAVLCRFLRTFEENYEEAKRKYNIIHNKESISVGIALTKEGSPYRKEIEPKVEELVRGKKGFLQGHEWLFYKYVSYEEAYPLLKELVRELPII